MLAAATEVPAFDHSWVPFRSRPTYLRLVDSRAKVLNYAAGAFHVCTSRGLAGGCSDPAMAIATTQPTTCATPMGRTDLAKAWADAATAYQEVYAAASSGQGTVDDLVKMLVEANIKADGAYASEGVDPPRDPELVKGGFVMAEPAMSGAGRNWKPVVAGAGVITAIALGLAAARWRYV